LPNVEHEADVINCADYLLAQHGLSFQHSKTCKTTFHQLALGQNYSGDMLQYLGFIYDGSKILIRSESIKNFYGRMKRNIGRYVKAAAKNGIPLIDLRKRVLVGRFTHWGDSRNFVQYAYRAAREMDAPEIKRQLRNHVAIFDRQWTKMANRYGP